MITFQKQIKRNIKKTWLLFTSFFVFVIFLGWLFSYFFKNATFLYLAVFIAISQSFLSYWFSDKIILLMMKAKKIERKDNPEIYQIVENLCRIFNLPLPKIYLINEDQPNAFATGRNKNHSAVVLTKGLLKRLEKSEIEGVLAHELAHIKNNDMLLQTITVTLVGFVIILSDWFLRLAGFSYRKDEEKGPDFLFIFAILAAILAPLSSQLIHFALSRKREFLADATSAFITKNPLALASALEKISSYPYPLTVASNATAHLFIVNPLKDLKIARFFSTHPPVEERIKILREMTF
jgi:heat shock protein HtpX